MHCRFLPVGLAILMLFSCGRSSSRDLIENVKNLGVYIQTSNDLVELPTFGVEVNEEMNETVSFRFEREIPVGAPIAFVVNMPDVIITESKVFLLPNINAAVWHYSDSGDSRDPKPIAATIETLSASMYKIIPPELPQPTAGYLCLWLKMPMGTPSRMYAVQLPNQAGRVPEGDVNTAATSPEMAAAELKLKANPDLEVVARNVEAGTITIRNKKTKEEVAINLKDILEGRIEFQPN